MKVTYLHVLVLFNLFLATYTFEITINAMQSDGKAAFVGVWVGVDTGNLLTGANGPMRSFVAVRSIALGTMFRGSRNNCQHSKMME